MVMQLTLIFSCLGPHFALESIYYILGGL